MNIRFGTIDDLPEVQRLNKALTLYERAQVLHDQSINEDWPYQPDGIAYWTGCLKGKDNAVAFIAETNEVIVGYLAAYCRATSHRHQNPVAAIETMFVEEGQRRHGVGSKLVESFKIWGRELSAARLEVMSWYDNHPAVGFYRRHGFTEDAVRLFQPAPEK